MHFSLFFPLSTVITPGYYTSNKHKKTLRGAEKKSGWLGTAGPRNNTGVSSLSFLSASGVQEWVLGKLAIQK